MYPAADLEAAKRFFGKVTGVEPYADSPMYVGYRIGEMEIGLNPNADKSQGALAFWTVDDIATSIKALVEAGGSVVQEPTDVGYGLLVASLKDPNGAIVGLRQPPKGQAQ